MKPIAESEPDIAAAIQRMGLTVTGDDNMEKTEELCQNLLVVLFTILWKGVETTDVKQAWKVRETYKWVNYGCTSVISIQ